MRKKQEKKRRVKKKKTEKGIKDLWVKTSWRHPGKAVKVKTS